MGGDTNSFFKEETALLGSGSSAFQEETELGVFEGHEGTVWLEQTGQGRRMRERSLRWPAATHVSLCGLGHTRSLDFILHAMRNH